MYSIVLLFHFFSIVRGDLVRFAAQRRYIDRGGIGECQFTEKEATPEARSSSKVKEDQRSRYIVSNLLIIFCFAVVVGLILPSSCELEEISPMGEVVSFAGPE